MKSLAALVLGLAAATGVNAQELANCTSPSGHANYLHKGVVPKNKSGWDTDKITGGVFTLRRLGEQDFDILFVDTTKAIHSSQQEGATVRLLRAGESDMTFIVYYPGNTIELYTFARETDGKNVMHMLVSKGGDATMIQKSSVMVASCGPITFVSK